MKSTKLRIVGAGVVFAAAIGSVAVYAHQSEHGGMGMMGDHMGKMEGMEGMMTMMSSMSSEEHAAMHEACLKMMDGGEQAGHSDHHDGSTAQ
ncbi:hypothetical protein SAMN04487962_12544 [Marinobacter segnicrescens]|jgi:hypothetical protein|uniref:Uncharacterized protein n=1 Tax=Marinobacter segnicrescens TaxID=430453 RepID=A0A1I0HB39_9GAMM|nr:MULTISPECIES: hypothetical protein [Marinobacter]UZD67334.1 hypothetical protein LJ360_08495 [Marinobacter sp. AN1]SET80165.1 hypothetical protein SAMN04487962_12544 [Marinobacter segnicrescens]